MTDFSNSPRHQAQDDAPHNFVAARFWPGGVVGLGGLGARPLSKCTAAEKRQQTRRDDPTSQIPHTS